jgi:integrase/recombinase XerD
MLAWSDVLAQFEAHLRQSGLAESTVAGYLKDVASFRLWLAERAGQEVSPLAFSSGEVEAYKQHLKATLIRAPASINRSLQSLRKFGRFAVTIGIRDFNPAEAVGLVEVPVPANRRILTQMEIEQLVRVAETRRSHNAARDCAILQLLLQTGIRVSELVCLQLADIDVTRDCGTLTIRGHEERSGRRLPLNEAARRALCTYLEQRGLAGASHLFLSREGKPLSIRSVQQIVASLGRAAGLDISARILRDTYATLLWRETGDLSLLTERLGHRRLETVLKYILPLPTAGSTTEAL